MIRKIQTNKEAINSLKSGVNKLSNVVTTTLGPRGRNVGILRLWGSPQVVHDGVTVAKEVKLEDEFENLGAQVVIQAAEKTNDVAGDGTTTAVLIASEVVNKGFEAISGEVLDISKGNINPMKLRYELEDALELVITELKQMSKPITTLEEKYQVANVSAQNSELGRIISQAIEKVGDKGVISVDESKSIYTEMEYTEGMFIDSGFMSPYFITDTRKNTCELKDVYVMVTDNKVGSLEEMIPLLKDVAKKQGSLLIVCDEIESRALTTFIINRNNGSLNSLIVKSPGFGNYRKELLEDIATVVGAKFISRDLGQTDLSKVTIDDLGHTEKVTSSQDKTVFIGGSGSKKAISDRVGLLNAKLKETSSEFEKERIEERIAKLSNGVAVIKVGAATESEVNELKLRVEDAVNATKAAVEEGIVVGGGVALLNSRKCLKDTKTIGAEILYQVLGKPAEKILKNAGIDDIDVNSLGGEMGINVITRKKENLVKSGIIDPTKVVVTALRNGLSAAIMVLTMDALIVEVEEKEDKNV